MTEQQFVSNETGIIMQGDSMEPVLKAGWTILYRQPEISENQEPAINEDCVIKLVGGGIVIKTLKPGSMPGLYTLRSFNPAYPDIENVPIEWAAVVEGTVRPQRSAIAL